MSHRLSLLSVAGTVALVVSGCANAPPPRQGKIPVVVATASRTEVPYTLSTNGIVEPLQTAAVEAQVGGILKRVAFTEGQDVKAGDVLFEIDARPYVAVLDQARGQLARDQAQAASAARDSARYSALVQRDYVTRSQADQVAATAASAAATVDADRAAVERAQVDVSNCTIRAPISGRTGALLVRQGNLVKANASTPMVVINQIQPILVRFAVPQGDLPDIQRYFGAGKPLAVQALASEGPGSTLDGTLAFVDNNVDSTTGTVLLKARFANTATRLWPGQFVDISLRLYVDPNALTVPSAAVLTGQNGSYVFLIDAEGKARQQSVQVARTADTLSVIGTGLKLGDRVVTDGQSRLVAGSSVVIRPAGPAEATGASSDSRAPDASSSGAGSDPTSSGHGGKGTSRPTGGTRSPGQKT